MTADFHIKQGDTSPAIEAILEDESGNPVDLTNSTVQFHMKKPNADSVKVDAPANIIEAKEGQVRYGWAEGDTDTTGRYHAEWEVTYADDTVETFPNSGYLEIRIIDEIA